MINPLEGQQERPVLGKGLGYIRGDEEVSLRPMPGDFMPGLPYTPGSSRMAGQKIKGIEQVDPTIFAKLFA